MSAPFGQPAVATIRRAHPFAIRRGYIDDAQLLKLAETNAESGYGESLKAVVGRHR